ncbi:MAG: hypothetical protein JO218_00720 [Burkholderiales bacterium]|nr:hypothetical protein [Burkholderiales bacterium]
MDRVIVYPMEVPVETHLLQTNRNMLVALGKLAAAEMPQVVYQGTQVNGMACAPTATPSLAVQVGPGEVYALAAVDNSPYSTLGSDQVDQIVKQGILMQPVTVTTPAPSTVGYAINYLIEVAYNEQDTGSAVLQYYNSASPAQPFGGAGGNGVAQATARQGLVSVIAKAGVAAPAGTQTTPAPDPGYVGLYVVTVAQGQAAVTGASIGVVANAPFVYQPLLEWTAGQTYPNEAFVARNGLTYKALAANTGQDPALAGAYWTRWGYTTNDINTLVANALAGQGGWAVVAANTTAVSGTAYAVNTSAGPVTLTLPANPSNGQTIPVLDAKGTFSSNALTVAQGGTATIMGLAQNMAVTTANASISLVYLQATNDWRIR